MANCSICQKELNTGTIDSDDCGGDCLGCMADAGDPDAMKRLGRGNDEESLLHYQLAKLREAYNREAEPIVKRLMDLQMVSGLRYVATADEAATLQQIQAAQIVAISPVKVWMDKDVFGTVHIYRQHEGQEPVDLIQIQYDHRHLDNASQKSLADKILAMFGGKPK